MATLLLLPVVSHGADLPPREEALVRHCVGAAWLASSLEEDRPAPRLAGPSQVRSDSQTYWKHTYQGASIPIPTEKDGWYLFLSGKRAAGEYGVLENSRRGVRYTLQPARELAAIQASAEQIERLGYPATSLTPIELLKLAVSIDPATVVCDPADIRATVDTASALFVRANAFSLMVHDAIYFHEDGLLGHSASDDAVSWTYLFPSRAQGALSFIKVSSKQPATDAGLGFNLGSDYVLEAGDAPPWMASFFAFLEAPTRANLLELRQGMATYSLHEDAYEGITKRLDEFRQMPQ